MRSQKIPHRLILIFSSRLLVAVLIDALGIHCIEVIIMSALELSSAVTALANAMARNRSPVEISLLAGIFVQLGDTLATIAAQRSLCEETVRANNE